MNRRKEKIEAVRKMLAGEIDPLREKQKIWMFKAGEVFRIVESGDMVKSNSNHFERFNGPNDIFFCAEGDSIPEDTRGQIIRNWSPDTLHDLVLQYLRLMGKKFKP